MNTKFTCYTKKINGEVFYFVKKFIVLPEYSLPAILEAFGMHKDFDKACLIAQLTDAGIKKQLLEGIETVSTQAKVIELSEVNLNSQRPAAGL